MTRTHEELHHEAGPLGVSGDTAKSIAERLVTARIQKGLTIEELSRRVKIREHFTQAIESGDWSALPTGLNGRGLIRLCARELGVPVPELDPSAHLTEGNARVELAQQADTNETIREHTIRTLKPGAVANPVERGAPPDLIYRSVSRGKSVVKTRRGAPVVPQDAAWPEATAHQISSNPAHSNPLSSDSDSLADDVVTPDIEDVLGLNLQASDDAASVSDAVPADQPSTLAEHTPTSDAEDPEDVPAVDLFGSLGMEAGPVELEQSGSSVGNEKPLSHEVPKTVPLGLIDDRAGVSSADTAVTQPDGIIRGEQVVQASLGDRGRRRGASHAGLYIKVGGLTLVLAAVIVFALAVLRRGNTGTERTLAIRDLSGASVVRSSAAETVPIEAAVQTDKDASSQVGDELGGPAESHASIKGAAVEGTSEAALKVEAVASGEGPEKSSVDRGVEPDPVSAASLSVDPAKALSTGAAPQQAAQTSGVETLGTGSARATLRIAASVELQVRADGRVVISGVRDPGEVEVLFDQKAEILTEDGSRISLQYGGWDHGRLGHEGRRRRLILHASPFTR